MSRKRLYPSTLRTAGRFLRASRRHNGSPTITLESAHYTVGVVHNAFRKINFGVNTRAGVK